MYRVLCDQTVTDRGFGVKRRRPAASCSLNPRQDATCRTETVEYALVRSLSVSLRKVRSVGRSFVRSFVRSVGRSVGRSPGRRLFTPQLRACDASLFLSFNSQKQSKARVSLGQASCWSEKTRCVFRRRPLVRVGKWETGENEKTEQTG